MRWWNYGVHKDDDVQVKKNGDHEYNFLLNNLVTNTNTGICSIHSKISLNQVAKSKINENLLTVVLITNDKCDCPSLHNSILFTEEVPTLNQMY
jgi:hypothetical protein